MSVFYGRALTAGGGTSPIERLRFTYTGQYNERLDDGVVELYTGGVFTVPKDVLVDLFLVGGGGAGGRGNSAAGTNVWPGGGGGGGYTKTINGFSLHAGTKYTVVIGNGGSTHGADGESTSFGINSVLGGKGGYESTDVNNPKPGAGGAGGSGGGGAVHANSAIGSGGRDGSDGSNGYPVNSAYGIGGKGQGTTTREFGEPTGKLYAGGGGGGRHSTSDKNQSPGGEGGGGTGSWSGYLSRTDWVAGTPGEPRTGGGGGGGVRHQTPTDSTWQDSSAAGGSGIVCIRLHKEKEGLDFTYSGDYTEREDGVVELRSSGTITFPKEQKIDIFCVGGGGAGGRAYGALHYVGSGGGGGGYTATKKMVSVFGKFEIGIGSGGTNGSSGGTTYFGSIASVTGGASGVWTDRYNLDKAINGANGGSGGGGGVTSNSNYGTGGYNGNNGEAGYYSGHSPIGGNGQGFTTREFGEPNGKLYAGGGGGGRYMSGSNLTGAIGGSGGGGAGGWYYNQTNYTPAAAGVANTGRGGGGGASGSDYNLNTPGAPGGSGIICIRVSAPLPELAGTWLLNERLYAPDNALDYFNISGYFLSTTGQQATFQTFGVNKSSVYFIRDGNAYSYYVFSTNKRTDGYSTIVHFNDGETASDELRAWLASNATKQ